MGSRASGPVTILLSALDRAGLVQSGGDAQAGQEPLLEKVPDRDHNQKYPKVTHGDLHLYVMKEIICSTMPPHELHPKLPLSQNNKDENRLCRLVCQLESII